MTETEAHIAFLEGEITTAESQGALGIALGFERAAGHMRQQAARIAELEEALNNQPCIRCRGTGEMLCEQMEPFGLSRWRQKCVDCDGTGKRAAAVLGGANDATHS